MNTMWSEKPGRKECVKRQQISADISTQEIFLTTKYQSCKKNSREENCRIKICQPQKYLAHENIYTATRKYLPRENIYHMENILPSAERAYLLVPLDAVQHQTREAFHRLRAALDNHNVVLLPEDGAAGQLELLGVDVHLVLIKSEK
jgi:hypothetical protein